jgi:hypothetical protein
MVDNDGLGRGAKVAAREGPPVRGAEDQALEVPWDFEQFYLREYRGVVDLADATHLLHVQRPRAMAEALAGFFTATRSLDHHQDRSYAPDRPLAPLIDLPHR